MWSQNGEVRLGVADHSTAWEQPGLWLHSTQLLQCNAPKAMWPSITDLLCHVWLHKTWDLLPQSYTKFKMQTIQSYKQSHELCFIVYWRNKLQAKNYPLSAPRASFGIKELPFYLLNPDRRYRPSNTLLKVKRGTFALSAVIYSHFIHAVKAILKNLLTVSLSWQLFLHSSHHSL